MITHRIHLSSRRVRRSVFPGAREALPAGRNISAWLTDAVMPGSVVTDSPSYHRIAGEDYAVCNEAAGGFLEHSSGTMAKSRLSAILHEQAAGPG